MGEKKDDKPIVPPLSEAQKEQARQDIEKEREQAAQQDGPGDDDGEGGIPDTK